MEHTMSPLAMLGKSAELDTALAAYHAALAADDGQAAREALVCLDAISNAAWYALLHAEHGRAAVEAAERAPA